MNVGCQGDRSGVRHSLAIVTIAVTIAATSRALLPPKLASCVLVCKKSGSLGHNDKILCCLGRNELNRL